MYDTHDNPLTTYSYEQARALWDAGRQAHRLQHLGQAAALYTRSLHICTALDWEEGSVYVRGWGSMALDGLGQKRQALALVAPVVQMEPPLTRHNDYFRALMTYVNIARSIPTSLNSIEAAYARIEQLLYDTGHTAWRSNVLLTRALLSISRYREHEALQFAQESWSCWHQAKDGPRASVDDQLDILVSVCRQTKNRALAQHYLEEWQSQPNERPLYRELYFSSKQSWIARWDQRRDDAIEWARRAFVAAEKTDRLGGRFAASAALVGTYLCRGEAERARPLLAHILAVRHTENLHIRFALQQLRGDFYLACARDVAGMPPRDDVLDTDFPLPKRIVHPGAVRDALQRAQRAYTAALREGYVIDERLACSGHRADMTERLARVTAIEERLDTHRST